MKKILFIVTHRLDRNPTQRFRFEQYLNILKENGFSFELSYIINEIDDSYFYSPGNYIQKIWIILKSFWIRTKDVLRANQFDIIFIEREATLTGLTFFEKQLAKSKAKIVFDFDDAIWNLDVSDGNKKFKWMKRPSKTSEIIAVSDLIFAGNDYLKNYALPFNKNVVIVPTTIDTEEYQKINQPKKHITIGWSGSITTIKHFELAVPFLLKIKAKFPDIEIKVIGDGHYTHKELGIQGIAWSKKDEIKELSSFDIGIMPLPNDEWAKGKCGLKGLQYMALEIPTIMSPVGVNSKIINHGVNGFLADKEDEWVDIVHQLIENKDLRSKIGSEARKTVLNEYSIEKNKFLYINQFNALINASH